MSNVYASQVAYASQVEFRKIICLNNKLIARHKNLPITQEKISI